MEVGLQMHLLLVRATHQQGVDMEIIWHILLTVCTGSTCIEQDVQWFEKEEQCKTQLVAYLEIPTDGDWDTVEYICKPVGSMGT